MPPVDSKEIDSAQILYGSLICNDLDKKISQSTEIRLWHDIFTRNFELKDSILSSVQY